MRQNSIILWTLIEVDSQHIMLGHHSTLFADTWFIVDSVVQTSCDRLFFFRCWCQELSATWHCFIFQVLSKYYYVWYEPRRCQTNIHGCGERSGQNIKLEQIDEPWCRFLLPHIKHWIFHKHVCMTVFFSWLKFDLQISSWQRKLTNLGTLCIHN